MYMCLDQNDTMPTVTRSQTNHDSHSEASSDSVREAIAGTDFNQADILPAPEEYLQRLDPAIVRALETISVNPEAPWDEAGEKLLRDWMDDAAKCAKGHSRTGYKLKARYKLIAMSNIMATALVFLTSSLFPCTDEPIFKYITVCISFISVIVANINTFFDYGPKYQKHFEYEGRFYKFVVDIEELLVTDVDFRPPKDKSMAELKERKGNLLTTAPEL